MKTTSKVKMTWKIKMTSNIGPPAPNFLPPPTLKNYLIFCLMTFPHDSHTTPDVKPEMLSGVQIGNGIFYIYIGVGARDLYIDKVHTVLDIFRFAVFFVNLWEISDFSLGQEKGRYQKMQVWTWAYECIYLVKFILLILTVENIEPLWVYGWQHSSYNLQMPTRPPARVRTLLNESFSLPPPLPSLKGSKRYYMIWSSCFGPVK